MPFPATTTTPEPRPSTVPRMARHSTAPGPGARPLILARARGPWTWMVHPAMMECVGGYVVPRLVKATHEPGAYGNGPQGGRGHVLHLSNEGWTEVPPTVPAVAFGIDRTQEPDILATYLNDWHGVTDKGRPVVYVADAWERPTSVGGVTVWNRDHAGFVAWRRELIELLGLGLGPDGELSEDQIRLATEPLMASIRSEAMRPGKMSAERVKVLVAHLPTSFQESPVVRGLLESSARS